jgi:DNA-binding MarR family transcriptional regulator
VERLVEAGYIERNVDPRDRRHQLLTLSEPGRALVDRFHELSSERLDGLLRGLSDAELRGLRLGVAALEREARTDDPATEPSHLERTPA